MKPTPFEYLRPSSLEEALDALAEHGDDSKPLAGGQSLIPLLAMRLAQPKVLVDLDRVPELRGRRQGSIGAMTTNAQLERQPQDLPPIVSAALPQIGHFQIRNRGTIGGALAHLDPAGEWPALALLLEARLHCRSKRGTRQLSPPEFMRGPLTTALQADELLVAVELPRWPAGARWAFAEVARRPGDFALAGAAATVIGGQARAVVFACGPLPQVVGPDGDFEASGDIHASAAYRREIGRRLLEKVLIECR